MCPEKHVESAIWDNKQEEQQNPSSDDAIEE